MSNPAKTPEELEDVLASIRRLVSDHSSASDGSIQYKSKSPEPAGIKGEDRLVLSPSFRVQDPEDPWITVADPNTGEGEETESETTTKTEPAEVDDIDVPVVEEETGFLETDVVDPNKYPTPDQSETEASDTPHPEAQDDPEDRHPDNNSNNMSEPDNVVGATDHTMSADPDAGPENVETISAEPDDGPSEEDLIDLAHPDGVPSDMVDFEPETGDDTWPEDSAAPSLLSLVARRSGSEDSDTENTTAQPVEEDGQEENIAPSDAAAEDAATTNPAEASEPVPFPQPFIDPENAETIGVADEDHEMPAHVFSTTRSAEDNAKADKFDVDDTTEDLCKESAAFTFPDEGGDDDGEDVLDEETLREIIVDVVREELQGVLGQRITRNVRKMVRREVRLALAADEID